MFQNDKMWNTLEKLKNDLRDAGCQGLANQIYIMQLKLEKNNKRVFMQELEELKANLKKLEELSSKLSFMLKEINYLIGGKNG